MATVQGVDTEELESKVKDMYKGVAENPHASYHFEMGRGVAERLGYSTEVLNRIPAEAIESFAGVGHYFDLADLREGEAVLDLGSGSGTDVFCAAVQIGESGRVVGVDMTPEQLDKAESLRARAGFDQVEFVNTHIERLPFDDESFDVVVSNGVINLSPDKQQVFAEIARVLRPGGRAAIADIIAERHMKESTVCNTDLWAACIAGAAQRDEYRDAIEAAGLQIGELRENADYRFISDQAQEATQTYGVKSVSFLATKKG
jgi:arsenite methyltransferase